MMSSNWHALPGPDDVTRICLPNDIVLLTRANHNNPSVTITGYIPSGSMYDPDNKLGLAYFTALMLMRGTAKHTFQEIFDSLESIGANFGFGASVQFTSFSGRALAEDLSGLLGILSECVREPVFPSEYVERLRYQFLTGLAIRDQDTSEVASLHFDKILFENHPYGRPEDGYIETIQRITQADLLAFHTKYFGPKGMVLVVVGDVTPSEVEDVVNQVLGDWQNPEQPDLPDLPEVEKITSTVRKHITIPGKVQTDLVMGVYGPQRNSADYMPAALGNNILGQFGLMGRIGDVVREQAGLAYYASTSMNAWTCCGSWEVSAGVNPVNLQRAIDLIIGELKRFSEEPVSAEELSDSQSNFIGRLPISMESNMGVAQALLRLERYQLGLDYYQRYAGLVNAVTTERILEVARKYITIDNQGIISAGPPEAGKED